MKRLKLISGIVLVFILGALAGALGTHWASDYHHVRFKDPVVLKASILKKLTRELDLRDDQKSRIGSIMDQMIPKHQDEFKRHRQEMDRLMDLGFSLIKQELDPDQLKRFEAHKKKIEDRKKRLRNR